MNRPTFIAGLIASVACFGLQAQSWRLKADIPFPFQAGEVSLPAGTYAVFLTSGVLTLTGDAGAMALVGSAPAGGGPAIEQGSLVFNKYGNEHFLAKVRVPDGYAGRSVYRTPREKELIGRGNKSGATTIRAAIQ